MTKAGAPIRLTAKEFDLLWFLASHPRRVFSRDQLMDRIWGYDAAVDTGTVTVHVRRLRQKIEHDPSTPAVPRDRLGRRLPIRANERARRHRRRSPPSRSASSPSSGFTSSRPSSCSSRASRLLAVVLPLAAVLTLRLGDVPHGRRPEDPGRRLRLRTAAVGAGLLLARSISRRDRPAPVDFVTLAEGDLSARASESGPRELAELGASFNEMASNVEQLFDARRQLVAWASHDLRTPIASMQAMLEAVEDGLAEADDYLPELRSQVERLGMLVEDLFELARIDAGLLTARATRDLDRQRGRVLLARARAGSAGQARATRGTHRSASARRMRAREGRTRPVQPADQLVATHALRRIGRRRRRTGQRGVADHGRGHGRRDRTGAAPPDVRPLLAR